MPLLLKNLNLRVIIDHLKYSERASDILPSTFCFYKNKMGSQNKLE